MKFKLYLFVILIFTSCTFTPDGLSFVALEEPKTEPPIKVTLSVTEDSLYLYRQTYISFSLEADLRDFSHAEIKYYDEKITTKNQNYSFYLIPEVKTDWTDLTIDFYVATESGSIANKLKKEFRKVTKKWKIKYVDLSKINYNSGYRVTNEGVLQVFLVKPKNIGNINLKYTGYSNSFDQVQVSGDTLIYYYNSYCYGNFDFSFGIYTSDNNYLYSKSVSGSFPAPVFSITGVNQDSCTLNVTQPSVKFRYVIDNKEYTTDDKNVKLPYRFNANTTSNINVYPYVDKSKQNLRGIFYVSTSPLGNLYYFKACYSPDKDKFYISTDVNTSLTLTSLPLPSNGEGNGKNKVNIFCSPNGKYIAGHIVDKIYNYNENATLKSIINSETIPNNKRYFAVTNDGAFTYLKGVEIVMKNLTGTGWESFSFTTDFDPDMMMNYAAPIANSIDGKYICVRGLNSFKIYDVSNHTMAQLVYNLPTSEIKGVIAHPTNPSLIYVKRNDVLELRSCADFELIKIFTISLKDCFLHSIDPYSNTLLYMNNTHYYFYNLDNSTISHKFRSYTIPGSEVLFFRNMFFTSSRVIDLNNYQLK